jgi:hypothetical protein
MWSSSVFLSTQFEAARKWCSNGSVNWNSDLRRSCMNISDEKAPSTYSNWKEDSSQMNLLVRLRTNHRRRPGRPPPGSCLPSASPTAMLQTLSTSPAAVLAQRITGHRAPARPEGCRLPCSWSRAPDPISAPFQSFEVKLEKALLSMFQKGAWC